MKRAIALLLVFVMVFALCGCGKTSEVGMNKNNPSAEEAFKVEEIKYVPASSLGKSDEFSDCGVLDYKITCLFPIKNGQEYPNTFNLHYVFLDENEIIFDSDYLQFTNMSYGDVSWATAFSLASVGDKILTPETIERIKTVKFVGYDALGNTYKEYKFDEPFVFNMTEVIFENPNVKESTLCSIGDTITCDALEITLNGISYQESIKTAKNDHTSIGASGDNVLCCLDLDIKNISKEKVYPHEYLDVCIDYNDGFTYSTSDDLSYLVNNGNDGAYALFYYGGYLDGRNCDLKSLEGYNFTLAIPCVPQLAEDSTSPLKIIFNLPNGNSTQEFVYAIR